MPHHDNGMEDHVPKGGWLNRPLRTQLAVLIILLECTVVLALVSHVITVPVPPEPMWTMTIGGPPAPAPAPFNPFAGVVDGVVQVTGEDTSSGKEDDEADADSAQRTAEKQRVADAPDHAAKTEPFNPFAGIVEGVACGLPAEELPHDNADDDSGTNGPETMSPQEFRERYGRVGDFGSTLQQLSLELGEEQKPDDVQEPPVLIMQGTGTLDNLPAEGGESGINVIINGEDL